MIYSKREMEAIFDEQLNDSSDLVTILGNVYEPADVLKTMDPTAYNCMFYDWLDNELSHGVYVMESDDTYAVGQ